MFQNSEGEERNSEGGREVGRERESKRTKRE
jgi:hypothetical protein